MTLHESNQYLFSLSLTVSSIEKTEHVDSKGLTPYFPREEFKREIYFDKSKPSDTERSLK